MRNNLFIAFFCFWGVFACSDYDNHLSEEPKEKTKSYKITIENAVLLAKEFHNNFNSNTRAANKNNDISTIEVWSSKNITEITKGGSAQSVFLDTMVYVINFQNDNGFVIVSSDLRAGDVIACVEHGHLSYKEPILNKSVKFLLNNLETYFTEAIEYSDIVSINPPVIDITTDSLISPLIPVKWGQEEPYNRYCINSQDSVSDTGCASTALGQLMAYYEHPLSSSGYYTSGLFDTLKKKFDSDFTRGIYSMNLGIWYEISPNTD